MRSPTPITPSRRATKNGYVRRAQRRLIDLGYLFGAADGTYGQNTADAVRAFQQMLIDNGVEGVAANGEADETTLHYLYSELLGFEISTPTMYNDQNPLSLKPGNLYAQAAVLIDAGSGEVLLGKNASERMYPASTTKIMTLLLGLERGGFDEMVTTPSSAGQVPGDSSRMPVSPGERLRYKDLLYGLMIRSGNDAANAIATLTAGSVDAFVERMNEKAQELGLSGTHYDNPHGYQSQTHYTTAEDMATLTRYALQNEQFREVFTTHTYEVPATSARAARTLQCSYLIFDADSEYYYPDAVGGKTGYTSAAGYCFVCAAERDGVELIAVIFKSGSTGTNRWTDAGRMFDYGLRAQGGLTQSWNIWTCTMRSAAPPGRCRALRRFSRRRVASGRPRLRLRRAGPHADPAAAKDEGRLARQMGSQCRRLRARRGNQPSGGHPGNARGTGL